MDNENFAFRTSGTIYNRFVQSFRMHY